MPVVSIGPETTAAARGAGLSVLAEAAEPSLEGLVSAVAEAG
jgi:uroporphyrinogen-III synthase